MMKEVVIVSAVRTAVGKYGGALKRCFCCRFGSFGYQGGT